jgi:hypothetical protein
MKIPNIELANMSRYRGELMGAAMLFIILFHVGLSRGDPFYGLRRCGNVGVDDDIRYVPVSGAGSPWSFPPVRGTYAVYPVYNHEYPVAQPCVQAHPEILQQIFQNDWFCKS